MPQIHRRALFAAALAALALPAPAALRRYRLIPERSSIAFRFLLNGVEQTGTVPVADADIRIDPDRLADSSADVSADIREARTGFVLVTQALLSAEVLDAQTHPFVRFRSTAVRLGPSGRISGGAALDGQLTLRGATRAISLDATLSRPPGSAPEDLSTLYVDLTGRLDRHDFGASGYPQLVAPGVDLDIRAEIRADG